MDRINVLGTVQEMQKGTDASSVPFADGVDINAITEGDDNPMFVTVEVLNEKPSKNKNRYKRDVMQSIAEQINTKIPDGYLGHLTDAERATKAPESQTLWVGAKMVEKNGNPILLAKGYVLPTSTYLRSYLAKAIKAGKKIGVSVYGEAERVFDKIDKVYDIIRFELESIDWARTGSQGMSTAFAPVIAREQTDNMNREEIIKSLTLEELKSVNPELVESLTAEIKESVKEEVKTELQEEMKKDLNKDDSVKEMASALGMADDKGLTEVVSEMKSRDEERTALLDSYIDSQLSEKLERPSTRPLIKKMVVSEMTAQSKAGVDTAITSVLESDEGKELIKEMTSTTVVVNPKGDNHNEPTSRKFTKIQ